MFRVLLAFGVVVFSLSSCAQTKQAALESIFSDISKDDSFSGAALVYHKKQVLLDSSYGYKDYDKKARHTNRSIFLIASNTKQFTAEIILKLMHEKKLKLTDKLNNYLPGYPNGEQISIYNLLTHTSGIYNYTDSPCINMLDPTKPVDILELIDLFSAQPLLFEPDTKYSYSNSNYALLGYIIEQITGKEYEQVVRSEIFIPLQMSRSGFDYKNLQDTDRSISYYNVDGSVYPYDIFDSTFSYAAGGIYSTTGDMFRWYKGLTTYQLLPAKVQQKAYEPYMHGYALGWSVSTFKGKRFMFHFGSICGFKCIELFNDETYVIILSNYMDNAIDKGEILNQVLEVLYSK